MKAFIGFLCKMQAKMLIACFLLLFVLPLNFYPGAENSHDPQRVVQVLVFALFFCGYLLNFRHVSAPFVDKRVAWIFILLFVLGVFSAVFSEKRLWAFLELALWVCSYYAVIYCAWCFFVSRDDLLKFLIGVIVLSCGVFFFGFFVSYAAAYVSGIGIIDPWLLIGGFDNIRFFGQYAIIMLPMLAFPILNDSGFRKSAFWLLPAFWMLLIFSGTRGGWIAMAVVMACFYVIGGTVRDWSKIQFKGFCIGMTAYVVLLVLIPQVLALDLTNTASERLTLTSSGRSVLWGDALRVWWNHPLLGIGPMHLANLGYGRAAHPHQFLLQWGAEMGTVSFVLMVAVLWSACLAIIRHLKALGAAELTLAHERDAMYVCTAAAVFAALALSMVDGVFVMPTPQIWLVVLSGYLLAQHQPSALKVGRRSVREAILSSTRTVVFACFTGMLCFVVQRDWSLGGYEVRALAQEATYTGYKDIPKQPRFWLRGRIEDR